MPQIFGPSTNTLTRVVFFGSPLGIAGLLVLFGLVDRSPYNTGEGVTLDQPVPFSHAHHVAGLGIDCRYCHTAVEDSSFAGLPPTATCMNCHSQIWTDSPMLEPVRQSWRRRQPIAWNRVHDLPDFAYFDHSIHVAKGVGCVTCHGPVDRMPLIYQGASLQMEWCLECHRDPAPFLRPREEVFNPQWEPPADREQLGRQLVELYGVSENLDFCSVCHR